MSEISAVRPTSFCNFNCICTKCDCTFKHYIESLDERRIANNIYSKVKNIKEHVQEDNRDTRRANCRFGQLCSREDCGFRHFIDCDGRKKFIAAYNAKSSSPAAKTSVAPSPAPVAVAATAAVAAPAATTHSAPRIAPTTTSSAEVVVLRNTVSTLQNKVKDLESIIAALQATNLKLEDKVESQIHIIAKLSKQDSPSKFASAGSKSWADLMAEESDGE